MRLDFNILWVEDQPQNVKAQQDRIDFLVRKEGFRLNAQFAVSVDEAKTYLSSDIFGDHIDLILMDYDLGTGPKGDDGLIEVRNIFRYKDIVFYSAQAANLSILVTNKNIQGVYCSTRLELPDRVNGVFQELVRKVLDIEHSRGIVMGATSDIDHVVNDCLLVVGNQGDGKLHESARKIIAERIKEIRERFTKEVVAVESATHVNHLFELHNLYTSVDRLNLLRKLLDGGDKHKEHRASLKVYASETIPKRNILAHVRVQRKGFSRKLVDKNGNELTSEQMKELRQALLEHQESFEKLAIALKAT